MTKTWTICLDNQANCDVSNEKNWYFLGLQKGDEARPIPYYND